MINLIIDDRQVSVEVGTTVLQACAKVGIRIPTLCHHRALAPVGSCRLCLVEVTEGKRTRLQASCVYPVREGLLVRTSTERVLQTRRIMIELLLARCPEVKAIRELAAQMGVNETRFPKKNDDCILCGLCVRVCRERMGVGAVNFVRRGIDRKVVPPFNRLSPICVACGACAFICPTGAVKLSEVTAHKPRPIPSEFDMGIVARPSIFSPFQQAVPRAPVIDRTTCMHFLHGACKACETFCEAKAINYDQVDENKTLEVGAIIVATGFNEFDPRLLQNYGYGKFPNVITGTQFERILSAGGPSQGHLVRPSDNKHPRKIAWLQCIGSRDVATGAGYCSSVCCMHALKQAIIAKEHEGRELETAIFFMDMRTCGRGFEEYYRRATEEYGTRMIRAKVAAVEAVDGTGNLRLRYALEDGGIKTEEFDLVVLSVGFRPSKDMKELANRLGIQLNEYSFCNTDTFEPVSTSREGIFVCGTSSGPRDIPETVTQASAAAGVAAMLLAPARHTVAKPKVYPPERDVSGQEPRIGLFVCHCGRNIGGVVDVPQVVEYARKLPGVVYVEENLYTCSQDTQEKIKKIIVEQNLNRIVVASCSPRTHEPLFRDTCAEAGLNPFLFEMANIRDQCSWVHINEPRKATQKAKRLVRMAIARSRLLEPLTPGTTTVIPAALVIGGGVAGMTAALNLAEQGFKVYLLEKESELGGVARRLHRTADGKNVQEFLASLIKKVKQHARIEVVTNATIVEISGRLGNVETGYMLPSGKDILRIRHGVTIVATGATELRPNEYFYGKHTSVMTQLELEKELATNESSFHGINNVVMIQCVGSRQEGRMYCSRVCCNQAIKNALWLKQIKPELNVYVLYRDIRSYGFSEEYYREAREKGVIFIRHEENKKPEVYLDGRDCKTAAHLPLLQGDGQGKEHTESAGSPPSPASAGNSECDMAKGATKSFGPPPRTTRQSRGVPQQDGRLGVRVFDALLGQWLCLKPDLLVLSPAIVSPGESSQKLAQLLKVPQDQDGFFMEAHVKLRPVDFATEGVFVCGLAHSPKSLEESIAQAHAAASRAATMLSKPELHLEATIANPVDANCDGCAFCINTCPYKAITLIEYLRNGEVKKTVDVDDLTCKGCGTCQATCPKKGIVVRHFKTDQILAMVEAALEA